ncbi:unnamed protein product [Arctogadus glacialis]
MGSSRHGSTRYASIPIADQHRAEGNETNPGPGREMDAAATGQSGGREEGRAEDGRKAERRTGGRQSGGREEGRRTVPRGLARVNCRAAFHGVCTLCAKCLEEEANAIRSGSPLGGGTISPQQLSPFSPAHHDTLNTPDPNTLNTPESPPAKDPNTQRPQHPNTQRPQPPKTPPPKDPTTLSRSLSHEHCRSLLEPTPFQMSRQRARAHREGARLPWYHRCMGGYGEEARPQGQVYGGVRRRGTSTGAGVWGGTEKKHVHRGRCMGGYGEEARPQGQVYGGVRRRGTSTGAGVWGGTEKKHVHRGRCMGGYGEEGAGGMHLQLEEPFEQRMRNSFIMRWNRGVARARRGRDVES